MSSTFEEELVTIGRNAGAGGDRVEFELDADPEPRAREFTIFSVDDHLVEPPDTFEGRVAARHAADAPKVVYDDTGVPYWQVEHERRPIIGGNAVSGRPQSSFDGLAAPARWDEMRKGTWDIDERIRDMDINGVDVSICFPSMVWGFAGQRFSTFKDPELGLASLRAYNDWVAEVWAGTYPDRIIPQQVTWFPDPALAAAEVGRCAELGFKAVAFSEDPEKLGYPTLYSDHWDPFLAACEETGTVIDLHIGSSSTHPAVSKFAPADVINATFSTNSICATADWLYSKIPVRFPDIKIVLSECSIGWVPWFIDAIERSHDKEITQAWAGIDLSPADVLRRNFWFTSIYDPSGFALRDRIGIDRILMESDYPHADSTWPDTQAAFGQELHGAGLSEDEIRKVTFENASAVYRHPITR